MRFGNVEVRPLGGGLGCLLMILFSLLASVLPVRVTVPVAAGFTALSEKEAGATLTVRARAGLAWTAEPGEPI